MNELICDYGNGTNVRCKGPGCPRRIFFQGPSAVSIRDGKKYLALKCESCGRVLEYEENELEIHGKKF
jgi:hypothetical protein